MQLIAGRTAILMIAGASCVAADLSRIDTYVRAEMERNGIPGAAVAVVRKGEVIYAQGFGVKNTETAEPMTADTPIDLASVSKSFTALGILELSRQGKVNLDAPVTTYLPELGDAFRRMRVRHLLRHTSGLTRNDDFRAPCCGKPGELDLDAAVGALSKARPSRPPGSRFVYANSNYLLLAAVIQRVSGRPFAVFMREAVFLPLGMRRTTVDPAEAETWGLAAPHERRWGSVQPSRSPFLGWYGSSLVKSTARDMAGYLAHVLKTSGEQRLEPYDFGWFIRNSAHWPGRPRLLEHGGDTWGGNTAAIVVPAWQMGAVVLLNIGAHRAAEMARGALALAAGLPPPRPAKAAWTSETDNWAILFTAWAAAMLAATVIYAARSWFAVRRGTRQFELRRGQALRASVLLLMAAGLVPMLRSAVGPMPESLRTGLSLLAGSSGAVLVLAALLGFFPKRAPVKKELESTRPVPVR